MRWHGAFTGWLGFSALACGGSGAGGHVADAGGASASGGAAGRSAGSAGSAGQSSGGGQSGGGGPIISTGGASHSCDNPGFVCKASALPPRAPRLSAGTWTNISPAGVPFSAAFTQGMAVDPCDPATMYLGVDGFDVTADQAGLYKTTDAGATWTKISTLDEPIRIRINPKNPQHLYVVDGVRGSSEGFWVSCDGGSTFFTPDGFTNLKTTAGIFQYDTYNVAVDPSDFNHLLVSHHGAWGWTDTQWNTSSGVLESKDGGESWIVHPPLAGWGTGHAINFLYNPALKLGDANTWLLGTQGQGMFRTADAGANWTKVSDTGIQHGGGSIYYDKAGILYASGATTNLRSTDNGLTWTPVSDSKGYNAVFGDGKLLYTAPGFGPTSYFTSPEGDGATWTAFNAQRFNSGPFEMALDHQNGVLYSANWGDGVWALKLSP